MRYKEKLKDPRWLQRSQEKVAIAGHCCEDCGAQNTRLQVHHVQYVAGREPWDYSDAELICCCRRCHLRREEIAREGRVLFQMADPAVASFFVRLILTSPGLITPKLMIGACAIIRDAYGDSAESEELVKIAKAAADVA